MNDEEVKIGALVQLNSGGPLMTVTECDEESATCTWIVNQGPSCVVHQHEFPIACLQLKNRMSVQ